MKKHLDSKKGKALQEKHHENGGSFGHEIEQLFNARYQEYFRAIQYMLQYTQKEGTKTCGAFDLKTFAELCQRSEEILEATLDVPPFFEHGQRNEWIWIGPKTKEKITQDYVIAFTKIIPDPMTFTFPELKPDVHEIERNICELLLRCIDAHIHNRTFSLQLLGPFGRTTRGTWGSDFLKTAGLAKYGDPIKKEEFEGWQWLGGKISRDLVDIVLLEIPKSVLEYWHKHPSISVDIPQKIHPRPPLSKPQRERTPGLKKYIPKIALPPDAIIKQQGQIFQELKALRQLGEDNFQRQTLFEEKVITLLENLTPPNYSDLLNIVVARLTGLDNLTRQRIQLEQKAQKSLIDLAYKQGAIFEVLQGLIDASRTIILNREKGDGGTQTKVF